MRARPAAASCAVVLLLAGFAGCGSDADTDAEEPIPTGPPATDTGSPSPEPTAESPSPEEPAGPVVPAAFSDVATGLTTPWAMTFLPDGSALVSERDTGRIMRVTADGGVEEVTEVPGVVSGGEGGLLGLAYGPDPASGPYVYAYLTTADDNRVLRMQQSGASLGEPDVVVDGIPRGSRHNGGGLAFGPDGMLYVATGDADDTARSQDRESLGGKILRMQPDGTVPADNPFGSLVWSYGHRNVQGLDFDDEGRLWASEFGQRTYDELNLIERGGNYGWPEVEGPGDGGGAFIEPVAAWRPTGEASPSGLAWVRDTAFLGALAGQRLLRVPLPGGEAGEPDAFAVGQFGRLRGVAVAPDGSLWVTTSNTDGRGSPRDGDDRVLRVTLVVE